MKQIWQATAVYTEWTEQKNVEITKEESSFKKVKNKTVQRLGAVISSSKHSYL